ncbi:MAG TPA: tetratricopeptide repeat protein [Candidatus Krumholzibacteria bacterium]|nr:tetratricopeptide repeat protein [Candidatus Krumholzibacteria bacterium]
MTRKRSLWTFILLAVGAAVGCQSVATTSAKLRNQEGNYELAVKLAREAISKNPKDAEAYFQLGVSYSNLDSVAQAYTAFMTAKKLDEKKTADVDNNIQSNFAKHYKLAQSSFNRQDLKTAAAEFEMATRANPTQAVAYYNLGVVYQRLAPADSTLHEKSLAAADKALDLLNPTEANYTRALKLAGEELIALDRSDEAARRFKRLIEEDPASYRVIEDLGMTELDEKNYEASAAFLKLAAQARERVGAPDAKVYYNIGVSLYNLRRDDPKNIDEAITYYKKALDITPDDPDTVFNILVAYASESDWKKASEWGEKYVSVDPADANGWKLLARSYTELGQEDKAAEAIKRYDMLKQQ